MSEYIWIRSHVEQLLQQIWDVCRVNRDDDWDFPFRRGTAAGWVSVLDTDPPMVRVTAHAAGGVKPTLRALQEVNELSAKALSARVTWVGGMVLVTQTISPILLSTEVLGQAVESVASIAEEIGPLFAAMFGGHTPWPAQASTDEEVP